MFDAAQSYHPARPCKGQSQKDAELSQEFPAGAIAMRRLFTLLRKPVLLVPLIFFAWTCFFRAQLSPSPQFVVQTGAANNWAMSSFSPSTWSTLRYLSNDGREVIIGIHHGRFFKGISSRLQLWDTRTGMNETPSFWDDPEWQELLSEPLWIDTGMFELLSLPGGKKFLCDEKAWSALRERLRRSRARALDDMRKTLRPVDDSEATRLFPEHTYFSPDGRLFASVVRNGLPLYLVSDSLGDGTAIEDVETGESVAVLPKVTSRIIIAPDRQTAVSLNYDVEREGEQPRLLLWDLKSSKRRAELLLPVVGMPFHFAYSADGKYVFANYTVWTPMSRDVRWWDSSSGRQIGRVTNAGDTALVDGGRVLVTHPHRSVENAMAESYLLCFWHVATGEKLGEWDMPADSKDTGMIDDLASSDSNRYLAVSFDPDYGRPLRADPAIVEWVRRFIGPKSAREDRHQIHLLDILERRELARLPGWLARLSGDGGWLATIDEAGVVRVWELPLGRPWGSILAYAAAATLACWLLIVVLNRLRRRSPRRESPTPQTAEPYQP
jgi:hypothetical protein